MKVVTIFKSDPQARHTDKKEFEKMGKLINELTSKGALVDTGGALEEGFSASVRRTGNDSFLEIAGDGSVDLHEVGETPKFGP